jgi:hypothetical protein
MENANLTISELLNAAPLSDDDLLPIDQLEAINPLTQKKGDTRKISVKAISDFSFIKNNRHADQVDGMGRDLMQVILGHGIGDMTTQSLRSEAIAEVTAGIRRCCNNSSEIDGSRIPDFCGLMEGDYLDGIDLSAIPAENGGDAGQPWNDTYKNNRIVIAGFNTYKGLDSSDTSRNHILFVFRNIPLQKRMNPTNTNAGGYHQSEVRAFLDGTNGNGTGDYAGSERVTTGAFLNTLKAQLGNHIIRIKKILDSSYANKEEWQWNWYSVFLPSENEVFGMNAWGRPGYGDGQKIQYPYYRSADSRQKKLNGVRSSYWTSTPAAFIPQNFSIHASLDYASHLEATIIRGCAPALCIA